MLSIKSNSKGSQIAGLFSFQAPKFNSPEFEGIDHYEIVLDMVIKPQIIDTLQSYIDGVYMGKSIQASLR